MVNEILVFYLEHYDLLTETQRTERSCYGVYLKNNWIHIYTDGSKRLGNVGGDVYSELFAFYASLGPFRANFVRELDATEQISGGTVQLKNFGLNVSHPGYRCT
ncbi:hypothetical protein CEXT_194011 [Caerostris extrusa]|uniref:LAGLIDADG homing endonuclease n=1 Tax=Caerostris extrusa TaxID=172846 RepID=A0AAV4REC4_CAEEX|nr:hypothetical protein CEXT_194011 [Caerostris extrusa]